MDFGYTGCHTSVPSLQKLAVYSAEALEELEAAILPKPARAPAVRTAAPRAARRPAAAAPAATARPATRKAPRRRAATA
jgi:hypothetical protein